MNPAEMDLSAQLNQIEQELAELKHEYEQYFLGLVRIEPSTRRIALQRTILRLGSRSINNSALRFRFQQLRSRFNTFQSYWNRVLHQIETGRYTREEKRFARRSRPAEPASESASRAAAEQPPSKLDGLYQAFIASRQQCGERTDNVNVERLEKFIAQQESQLKAKYGDRPIDFKVVVEDGRTKLRAILKK